MQMNGKYILFIFLLGSLYQNALFAQQFHHLITFFVKDFPETFNKEELQDKIGRIGHVSKKIIKNQLRPSINKNIFATYMGYLTVSDEFDQITFPRRTEQPKINFLITSEIRPILMVGNTIAYLQIPPNVPAKMLTLERKQYEHTKTYYWLVKYATPPNDGKIPLQTILLFAQPDKAYMPTGAYSATDSPHLILPDVFVKKGFNGVQHALFVLTIKHFFGPITRQYLKRPNGFASLLV